MVCLNSYLPFNTNNLKTNLIKEINESIILEFDIYCYNNISSDLFIYQNIDNGFFAHTFRKRKKKRYKCYRKINTNLDGQKEGFLLKKILLKKDF
jgi:hypothetical protein